MRNYTFKKMQAKDFLEKVIEREENFKNTNYSDLSFEEKCEYALYAINNSDFNYTFAENDLLELKADIQQKAEVGKASGLYYLAKFSKFFDITSEAKLGYLKRSADMGYMPALVLYLRTCPNAEERYKIACELVDKISSVEPISLRCIAIKGVYDTLRHAEGKDKYPSPDTLTYDLYLELAKAGDNSAFFWLEDIAKRKAQKSKTDEERRDAENESAFWQTVWDTVAEHYKNSEY